jgi:uncharacterized membrane protein
MMSDKALSIAPRLLRTLAIGVAVTIVLIVLTAGGRVGVLADLAHALHGRLHAPRLDLLAVAPPQIQIHVVAVSVALCVGVALMLGVKGRPLHRALGWTWVAAMATAAISSLFIHHAHPGAFSFLHLFAGWTLIALPVGVAAARTHRVRLHQRTMTGLFVGGLLIAGVFAFLPGRLMWRVVFG